MCGIAGFYGDFEENALIAMSKAIAHRGPDDDSQQVFSTNHAKIGLAHRRLSIIDLTQDGRQPMTSNCQSCKGLWLIYNGEIYNFKALRELLINKGHTFKSHTDSEVLLHLYVEYGAAMLTKLNGIFAFAIYDPRNSEAELLIARDGLGVKPLYYAELKKGFVFCSEMKGILAAKLFSPTLDPIALHYYLTYLWAPGSHTALKEVRKLQPGEALLIKNGKIRKSWFYYDVPYHGNYIRDSQNDIAFELDKKLKRAIQRQLIADVPVGAFLSGGLDSSAVVAYMRQALPHQPINCYCIAFDEGMGSEKNPNDLPYAQAVAKHLDVNLHVIKPKADMINQLSNMIYHLDEPQADPAPIHVFLIAKLAREQGIKVLLSGTGGDDIFSGYRRHQALLLEPLWRAMPHFIRKQSAQFASTLLTNKRTRRLAKLLTPAHLSPDERLIHHFYWNTEKMRASLYAPDIATLLSQETSAAPLLNSLKRIPNERHLLNRLLYLETKHFLADHNLNYTDKMAMAVGVEVRVPLLDLDIVNYAATIPVNYKLRGLNAKAIFKRTMRPYLPHNVIYRSKAGFGAPMRRWLHHELKPMIADLLSPASIRSRGLFSEDAITQLILQDKKGQVDGAYTIFSLLCIELWCRTFL